MLLSISVAKSGHQHLSCTHSWFLHIQPLHCACVSCNVPFVDEIMSFCAPVPTQMTMEDSKDNEKKTAKHELPLRPRRVHKGSKHLYNTVLEARDLFGNTPLHIAALW